MKLQRGYEESLQQYALTPLQRRDVCAALGLVAIVLLAGASRMVVGVCGVYHDDAIYVSTAKALAGGEGYRLINLPWEPLQTKYPILYPALLAGIWRVWPRFPDNLLAMQGLSLLAGAGAAGLGYLYLVRFGYFSRRIAAASGLICATAPIMLYLSTETLSEMPFALMVLLSLWSLDGAVRKPRASRSGELLLGCVIGLPFLCRSIGVALIPAALYVLFRARCRLRWVVMGLAGVTLPWVLWSLGGWLVWHGDPGDGYYTDYLGWWSTAGWPFLGRVFGSNLLLGVLASANLGLAGFSNALLRLASPVEFVVSAALGLALWGAVISRLRAGQLLPWFLIGYALLFLLCPWPPRRFLAPVLPLLIPHLILAVSGLFRRVIGMRRYVVPAAVGVCVAVTSNLTLVHRDAAVSRRTGFPHGGGPEKPPPWSAYERVFDWLRTHARSGDVVASGLDSMIYLYTGLHSFRPFTPSAVALFYGGKQPPLGSLDTLVQTLRKHRTRFLVRLPLPGFSEEQPFLDLLAELQTRDPDWLTIAYESDDGRFVVFELQPDIPPIADASGEAGRF